MTKTDSISAEAREVLEAIKAESSVSDDMPDWKIWKAEDELSSRGLICRDERSGEWVAR